MPDLVQAKKKVQVDFYLSNQRTRSAFEVFVEIQIPPEELSVDQGESTRLIHVIRPGKTVKESMVVRFLKRGVYRIPKVTIGSTFPFNLFRFRHTHSSDDRVIVTPSFTPLQKFQLPGDKDAINLEEDRQLQFAHAVGESEYIGNREYQAGMPVRRWDFSSWARTGKPVVREYRENQRGMATLFIDSFFADDASPTNQEFESLLSLATAIVDALSRKAIVVSRLVIGPTIYSLIDTKVEDQLRTIGRKLALAEISSESEAQVLQDDLFLEQAVSSDAYAFLLFNKWDTTREKLRECFQERGRACISRIMESESREFGPLGVTQDEILSGEVSFK